MAKIEETPPPQPEPTDSPNDGWQGGDVTRTELVWPAKYDSAGRAREVERVSLPFQVIERVNESRATRLARAERVPTLFDVWKGDEGESFEEGWRNKLIWGDNKLVMSSLLEQYTGKIDLIYIDPPFATGAIFAMDVPIGDGKDSVFKEQSVVEEKAYRDTWGAGLDSYLEMLVPRLQLLRELLSPRGSLLLHLGVQVNHPVWVALEEVFGRENVVDEIIWSYGTPSGGRAAANKLIKAHEYILYVARSYGSHTYNKEYLPYSDKYIEERFTFFDEDGRRYRERGRGGGVVERQYLDESKGVPLSTVWTDIKQTYALHLAKRAREETGFQTQKPEALLERIIKMASNEGDLVADFFCGSGTTMAVAEKLGRRWIGGDLGRYAIHVSRKRLLEIENCHPFEVLNLGKYERRYWRVATFGDDLDEDGVISLYEYVAFILKLYGAAPTSGLQQLHGKAGNAFVHVGAVDAPVTIGEVAACVEECAALKGDELHVLGWEWEMGMNDLVSEEAKRSGVKVVLRQIPREVMEEQAAAKGDVQFFELAYLEARAENADGDREYVVMLENFVIPNPELVPADVREKITKWSDYVDYWAVDWDFQDDTFMQGWVTYRTRSDRKLELSSDPHDYPEAGEYRVMVKVIDVFGNDTSKILSIQVD